MSCSVKIIAHSISPDKVELITFELRYWRAIHGEFMTHRVFSRNASSSRAIPISKVISQVWNDPAGPIHWGKNQRGMQAESELQGWRLKAAQALWRSAGKVACVLAWGMDKAGLHKQVTNRILEPWQYISVVMSTTKLGNFYALRDHPDAQPEIKELAQAMKEEHVKSKPRILNYGEWHLPYVTDFNQPLSDQIITSVARCARVSYNIFGGGKSSFDKDKDLYLKLVGSNPKHASPTEHQASPLPLDKRTYSNFHGWEQHRLSLESLSWHGNPVNY